MIDVLTVRAEMGLPRDATRCETGFCYRCGLDTHPFELSDERAAARSACAYYVRPQTQEMAVREWAGQIMTQIAPYGGYEGSHADFLVQVADSLMSLADAIVLRMERQREQRDRACALVVPG